MRYLLLFILIPLLQSSIWAQTKRMNHAETGRTYTIENQSRTVQPLLLKATQQFRTLNFEDAIFTLDNAIAQNPNSFEALLFRARLKKMTGMQTEAEMDLRRGSKLNPYAANLYGYYGNGGLLKIMAIAPEQAVKGLSTFQKLNYYYLALDNKILSENNKDTEVLLIENVVESIEANFLEEALTMTNSILEQFPESAISYDLQGMIFKKQGKLENAIQAFSTAVEVEPDFAIAWYNLGQIERSQQNFEKAEIYLNKAIELQSDLTKAYFERALLYKQIGEKESALSDYNTIIEQNGNTYMEAFLNRGLTKKMLGDYGGALADLNKAIEDFPYNATLRKNRGNLHLLYGLHRKAIDDYTEAIALNKNDKEAYFNRALTFFLIYDNISGCADLEKSIELGYEKAEETRNYFCTK